MVQGFYAGARRRSDAEAPRRRCARCLPGSRERWKDVEDADAERILVLGDAFSVGSRVVRDPSAGEIVAELRADHPVIAVVDMYALGASPRRRWVTRGRDGARCRQGEFR